MEIRAMTAGDMPAVEVIQRTILQAPDSISRGADLAEMFQKKTSRCLVAVEEGQVIAFVIGEIKRGAFGAEKTGWLDYVGVSPKRMGQGIGGNLAKALFEVFEKEGVENVYTAVRWDSVDMLSFFKSLGFDRSNFVNLRKRLR